MLNKFASNKDTIIEKENFSNILISNNNINTSFNNKVLVVDEIKQSKVFLKWVNVNELESFKVLLDDINDLKENLIKDKEKIIHLQNNNNELLFKLNYLNENILKINDKILDESSIDKMISFKIQMILDSKQSESVVVETKEITVQTEDVVIEIEPVIEQSDSITITIEELPEISQDSPSTTPDNNKKTKAKTKAKSKKN